jgi:hypothetical protein
MGVDSTGRQETGFTVAAQIGGRKVDQVGDGSSTLGPGLPAGEDDDASTQPFVARAPVTAPWPAGLAIPPPPRPPTGLDPPRPPAEVRSPALAAEVSAPAAPAAEVNALAPPTQAHTPTSPAEVRAPAPPTQVHAAAPPTQVRAPAPPTEVRAPAPPTEAGAAWAPTDARPLRPRQPQIQPFRPPTGIVRYGPGVPAGPPAPQPGPSAERVWRTGQPAVPGRRRPRLGRLLGASLTVILLAASGVALYLRVHHPPFHVTGVVISQQTRAGCGVDVTGRIATNGAAGTVSYQWLFRPALGPPQPLSQSVIAGQQAVYVTVAVEGSGHGRASQTVTLQVLGPDPGNAATAVVVSC